MTLPHGRFLLRPRSILKGPVSAKILTLFVGLIPGGRSDTEYRKMCDQSRTADVRAMGTGGLRLGIVSYETIHTAWRTEETCWTNCRGAIHSPAKVLFQWSRYLSDIHSKMHRLCLLSIISSQTPQGRRSLLKWHPRSRCQYQYLKVDNLNSYVNWTCMGGRSGKRQRQQLLPAGKPLGISVSLV